MNGKGARSKSALGLKKQPSRLSLKENSNVKSESSSCLGSINPGASTTTKQPSLKKNKDVRRAQTSLRRSSNPNTYNPAFRRLSLIPNMDNPASALTIRRLSLNPTMDNCFPSAYVENIAMKQDKEAKKEAEFAAFIDLLKGKYKKLPPKTPKEVRVFLSSTFTDMTTERNTLAKCYNELKDFCQSKYNIDFSVVDMRWGVTDEASNDHSTEEVCIREIENCKRVGLGPTFVTILGDRYGTRLIPKKIPDREYEDIIHYVSNGKEKSLIEKWYKKDVNADPPEYLLQPIKSIIHLYGEKSRANAEWTEILSRLANELRAAVIKAHTAGKLNDERKHVYNMSVTESEVRAGIKSNNDPNWPKRHCTAFIRTFKELSDDDLNQENSSADQYTDFLMSQDKKKELDKKAAEYKKTLRDKTIPGILHKSRIKKYESLIWHPDGVTSDNHDHKPYLKNLSKDFIDGMKEMIENDQKKVNQERTNKKFKSNYDEIVHHLYFCRSKCETFVGRDNVLTEVKNKINYPLILHAESGGGKTSVMAKIFERLPIWFENNIAIRVIRFLGTSPLSSNIHDVLKSLVQQLADITGEILVPSDWKTMKSTLRFLPIYFKKIMKKVGGKVVVLLDSIDQLSTENNAHNMEWLNREFPKDFHIIISTMSSKYNILDNCRKRGLKNMIEVKSLDIDLEKFLRSHLKKRHLQPDQEKLIRDAFQKVPNVLFLKLAIDKAIKWQSYTPLRGLHETLGSSVQASITEIFTSLENKYGKVLVSHSLGYITAGNGGLSTVEIEDVLSIDDEVLNDVYVYHPPPVPGIVRIPSLLWARIQYSIKEYLVERSSHGKTTFYWYHRQFIETATQTYLPDDTGGNAIHEKLATLYLAENGIQKDITLSKLIDVQAYTVRGADRQITKQPLAASNIRALMCIPYHLQYAGNIQEMKTHCMFRLEFILKKIEALGVQSFLDDIQRLVAYMKHHQSQTDQDIETLLACFWDINTEERNPKVIVSEILGHIQGFSSNGRTLVEQCFDYFRDSLKGFLLPLHSCFCNKADLFNTWKHVVAMPSHYGDYLSVEVEPDFTKQMGSDDMFALLDISGKLPVLISNFKYHPVLLKERNTALAHGNFHVGDCASYKRFKENKSLTYDQITEKIDKQNENLPEVDIPGDRKSFNIQTSLVGRGAISWEPTLTTEESSSKGNYMSLVFGKNIIIHRPLKTKFGDHSSMLDYHDSHRKSKDKIVIMTKLDIVVKIRGKDEKVTELRSQNILEQQASGNDPHVLHANYLEQNNKTIYVLKYTEGDRIYTSVCLLNLSTVKFDEFSLQGQVRKWMLLKDETRFATSIYDSNTRDLKFLVVNTEKSSKEVLPVPCEGKRLSGELVDVSYSSNDGMKAYVLTKKALYCMDLINKEPVNTNKNDYSTATYMTVEDDGEYMYIGNSTGRLDCIKVLSLEYLGCVDLSCGSIDKIILSASDVNIIIHGTKKQLVSMSQKRFVNTCRKKHQLKVAEKSNSMALDFYTEAELLMLITKTTFAELVTFQKGQLKIWSLKALNEPKSSVPYGQDLEDFIPQKMHFNSALNTEKCLLMRTDTAVVIDTVKWSSKSVGNLEGGEIVASTQVKEGFYIVTLLEEKLTVNFVPYSSSDVSKVISLKDSLKGSNVDICVTASQKYMAIKMECPDEEYKPIKKEMSKEGGAVMGRNKFYCLDLSSEKVTPCNRFRNDYFLLADTFAIYQEHKILLGVDEEIHHWDLSTGEAKTKFVKETKNSMFFTTNPERFKDKTSKQASNREMCNRRLKTRYNGKECQIVCTMTSEGIVNIYKGSGEVVYNSEQNKGVDKREKLSAICHVWISPDSSWIATVCESRILQVWSTEKNVGPLSQFHLDVDVTQGFIANDQHTGKSYLAILGNRCDHGTKVLLFEVVM